jgi:hypothetical protein
MKHEAYFAGKLNGKSSRVMMENAEEFSKTIREIVHAVHDNQQSKLTWEKVSEHLTNYENLLGTLDALFAHVRGVESGLLPTEPQIEDLEHLVKAAKHWWRQCRLTTLQPKWHLIFDGHLLEQVCRFGGLADKIDDFIEKAHQPWKREKERTWGVKNFKQQQVCQLMAVRKRTHYKIDAKIEENARKRKRNFAGRSHLRELAMREAKQHKRQQYSNKYR